MIRTHIIGLILLIGWNCFGQQARNGLNLEEVRKAASETRSVFLNQTQKISTIETFVKLVKVKGPSGQEQAIAEEVKSMLTKAGAMVVAQKHKDPQAPHNLVMEIAASPALANKPGILLNAHLDTIHTSTPDLLAFDRAARDFYHPHEKVPGKVSSFGGDDRSGVAAIVEAVRVLQAGDWKRGTPHRRIVLVFTADEERGCVGAQYLVEHEPQVFENVEFSLSIDGPLDLRSKYPEESFVAVALESDRKVAPYDRLLKLIGDFCKESGTRFGVTELGLGMGDFEYFPPTARAGLHLRSPVRGWHNKERVNVQDMINHVELLCHILRGFDEADKKE